MEEKTILSVGIDIGTTTTQLVFSSLALRNTAGPTQVPRYAITERGVTDLEQWLAEPEAPEPHLQAVLFTKVVPWTMTRSPV